MRQAAGYGFDRWRARGAESMTLRVLVTTDGSDKDERAIAVAAALVELADADSRVLRVFQPPISVGSASVGTLGVTGAPGGIREDAVRQVRDAAARLRTAVQRDVISEVVDGSDVAATLLDEIAKHDPDFVIMATRAAGALGRAIHGGVADRLVRESPTPVVLVPPRASYLGGKEVTLRRVLVPLDGSEIALSVIPRLLELPLANKLEFVLIQAVQPEPTGGHAMPPGTPNPDIEGSDDDEWSHVRAAVAETRLGAVANRLRARGSHAEVRVIESRDPGAVIVDAVRNDLVELIAMSTRGASGLRRMVLGSVAEYVVRRSEIPVLLVTARSAAAVPLST
jgi:Universal stress protein UspA and related nucleotide-binding proteins